MQLTSKSVRAAVAVGACLAIASARTDAAIYVIESNVADYGMFNDGTNLTGSSLGFVGGSDAEASNVMYGFYMPKLQPGETVESAMLSVPLLSKYGGLDFNVDAYYVGGGTGPISPVNTYYAGADHPDYVKVADDLFYPFAQIDRNYLSSDATDSVMAQYVRYFYQFSPPDENDQKYLLVQLVPDTDTLPASLAGYQVAMSEHASIRPTLTVITPEPGSLAMAGIGALALLARRRRA